MKRIGVLTGGGDCPGLNAVIRAVAKTAFFKYQAEVIGILDGYSGLVEGRSRPIGLNEVSGILPRGGTILGTCNKSNPFAYLVEGDKNKRHKADRSQQAIDFVKKLKLDGLVVIGGDGTQASALKFFELGLPIVSVPKTIDNDLAATDVTFGFDSALSVATEAVDRLHTTGDSHKRVMVLEVMGRYAGWIALRAGIAGGGDVILIPEIPYDIEKVCASIEGRSQRGKNFSIVVVAEGVKMANGEQVVKRVDPSSPDPIRLGGVGSMVAQQIEKVSGLETRITVLGHLQRGGSPTPYDRWLATRYGVHAVDLIAEKQFGQMVSLRGTQITSVSVKEAVAQLRLVDPKGEEVLSAKAVGTCFGD